MSENNENVQPQPSETPVEQPTAACDAKVEDKNARTLAMLCHLLGVFGFLAPLIIWLIKKDDHEFVDSQGKSALNWQISVVIYFFVSMLLIPLMGIGILLMWAVSIANLIFCIVAALKARDGVAYSYPLAIKFLK
jgi:uncharacterized protein